MPDTGDAVPLAITVTDGGYASTDKTATRATENGYRTEFTDGDACGLYIVRGGTVVYDNVKLSAIAGTDGLTWHPSEDVSLAGGLSGEQYFLYYPYKENMKGKTNASATDANGFFDPLVSGWQPEADQSTYTAYTTSDLMTATGTASKNGNKLTLSFSMTHRMALAVIEMPKTVYQFTDSSIPDYIVELSTPDFSGEAKPCGNGENTYRYLVNPNSSDPTLTGSYADGKVENVFDVTMGNMDAGSYKTYKVDGGTLIENYKLQIGDYFCKDNDDNWYIIPQAATPDGNVIGIVFHAGQHEKDGSDYSESGIGQAKCHGYVVALTDVNNDDSDRLRWEWGPAKQYDQIVGVSSSTDDWNGYSNSLKFHEFVNDNNGWDMKHFPAALACETYGNRTTDQNGNPATGKYDWQEPLAAPHNSSGWFLPSCGQLKYLYQNGSLLSSRMTDVKNSTRADYKNKIKWFYTILDSGWFYWSSTEYSYFLNRAWSMDFNRGLSISGDKNETRVVRAVLAF